MAKKAKNGLQLVRSPRNFTPENVARLLDKARKENEEKEKRRAIKEAQNVRNVFVKKAMNAGFSKKKAIFLYDNFADINHEHSDIRFK